MGWFSRNALTPYFSTQMALGTVTALLGHEWAQTLKVTNPKLHRKMTDAMTTRSANSLVTNPDELRIVTP
jgi:hypothetical protein